MGFAVADQNGTQDKGTNQTLEIMALEGSPTNDAMLSAQPEARRNMAQLRLEKFRQVRENLKIRKDELKEKVKDFKLVDQNRMVNQNRVRLAVHALLDIKDELGGIGQRVSEIARDFNLGQQKQLRAEERIVKRSGFVRFFTGGDFNAADELMQRTEEHKLKIQELRTAIATEELDEDTLALLEEQIQNMEQEQNRLHALAQKEKKSKGLLGWIWK